MGIRMPRPMLVPTAELTECLRRWGALWGVPELADRVHVKYSARLRGSAGRCRPSSGRISLSATYLWTHPEELLPALCREAAHVAVWLRYGTTARRHGDEWRALVVAAGYSPLRFRPAPMSRERFLHHCPECRYVYRDWSRVSRWACPLCGDGGRRVVLRVVLEEAA